VDDQNVIEVEYCNDDRNFAIRMRLGTRRAERRWRKKEASLPTCPSFFFALSMRNPACSTGSRAQSSSSRAPPQHL